MPLDHLNNPEHVFDGRRIDVYRVSVEGNDGQQHPRELVVHPGAVVVLPLVDATPGKETVAMIRNTRFAVNQTLLELPAGTLEPPPETPGSCAKRELIEEAGYEAKCIEPLTEFYTTPGICDERMVAFLATELTHVGQQLEANEQITVEVMPLDEVLGLAQRGEIKDGKTLATLLFYTSFCRNKK